MSAVRQSSGDLILFSDQDDIWHEEKIAVLAAIAETSPNMVFSHDISLLDKGPEKQITYSYFQYLLSIGLSPAVCFKRNTSGWIASNKDRVRSSQSSPQCDYELMIELVIKQWNLSWTRYFVEAVKTHAIHHEHKLAGNFFRALDRNTTWYFTAPIDRK